MTFPVRAAISFAALAVTLAADYWFVHRPEPHGVAEFNPIKARLGKEELILTDPAPSGASLLSHQGGMKEVVEVFFEKGLLSTSTQRLLKDQPWAQSRQPRNISYTTLDTGRATGDPCRTFVEMKADGSAPSELRLFQDGIAGGEDHREFSIKANKRLQVDLLTAPDDSAQPDQLGCHKLLQAGDGQIELTGAIPLSVLAEAGSSVRLKFLPAASSAPIWKGAKGLFEPFQGIGLVAGSVRLSPIGSQYELFWASAPKDKSRFTIDGLLAGSDTLQMQLSGVGWVTVNGRSVSPTLAEWISANSLRAGLAGFVNLAIFCGVIVLGAGSRKSGVRWVQWATGRSGIDVPSPAHGLVVFLCHCSEDKLAVRQIDERLKADGFQPWLDEDDIFPARLWDREIKRGLQSSHAVVVCLSKTFERKEGYVQKELRFALDLAEEKLDDAVFLIPLRLEECAILPSLSKLHFIDWFKPDGHERLLRALSERARQVGVGQAVLPAAANPGGF